MLKRDVQLGHIYDAKVSGRVVPVRITREHPNGGWEAINPATNRTIRVRTAARLRPTGEEGNRQQCIRNLRRAGMTEEQANQAYRSGE
jgi:hypothetical protein